MQNTDITPFNITEKTFIKDYKKTAAILDEATRRTIKHMNEMPARV